MSTRFKNLADVKGVVAVYSYEVPYGTIPLLVVNKKIDRKDLGKEKVRETGGIILTKKDIEQGADVFALRFLHMQEHASLVEGKDVLAKIDIKKKHARDALEAMLRVTLIDLREMMVKGSFEGGHQLALTLDRIYGYMHVLIGKKMSRVKKMVSLCKKEVMTFADLSQVYEVVEEMTKEVDSL